MDMSEFAGAKRMKAELLEQRGWDGEVFTISGVGEKVFTDQKTGVSEKKAEVFFGEAEDFPLLLNKTQTKTLIDAFGFDSEEWTGRKVQLIGTPTTNPNTGSPCMTITLKPRKGLAQAAPGAVAPPAATSRPATAVKAASPKAVAAAEEAEETLSDPFAE